MKPVSFHVVPFAVNFFYRGGRRGLRILFLLCALYDLCGSNFSPFFGECRAAGNQPREVLVALMSISVGQLRLVVERQAGQQLPYGENGRAFDKQAVTGIFPAAVWNLVCGGGDVVLLQKVGQLLQPV